MATLREGREYFLPGAARFQKPGPIAPEMSRAAGLSTQHMNTLTPVLCASLLLGSGSWLFGQGVVNPGTINATVTITNPAGAVRNRLLAAGGPQIRSHYVAATAGGAPPRIATGIQAPTTPTGSTLPLTVEATGSPAYTVSQRLDFEVWLESFYWPASAPVVVAPGATVASAVSGQVSIVHFTFGTAIAGGRIRAYPAGLPGSTLADAPNLPAGATECEFVVPVGVPLELELGMDVGSGGITGTVRRVARRVSTWNAGAGVPANTIQPVALNLNDGATLGGVKGNFDVAGETEVSLATGEPVYVGLSGVTAAYASVLGGNWQRRTVLTGAPSSGQFTLSNLTSSASIAANDPGSYYYLFGEAILRRTLPSGAKAAQYFRTGTYNPAPAINVPAGSNQSVGDALVIQPGYVRGAWSLLGPPAEAGRPPVLGAILTAADADLDNDGLPDAGDPYSWNARSTVSMAGVSGASSGAVASQVLERLFTAPNVSSEYELALGGTGSATSTWTPPALRLTCGSGNTASADVYFDCDYNVRRAADPNVTVTAGAVQTQNFTVPMGELCLTLRAAAGSGTLLYTPEIRGFEGGLTGAAGNAWTVAGIHASGWPITSATAAVTASMRLVLPAGTYTIAPNVLTKAVSGALGSVSMLPFTVTIPPAGRACVDNGVSLSAGVPACVPAAGQVVNGTTSTDGATVDTITWSLDGGAFAAAAHGGGVNSAYSFTLPAGLAGGTHTVTVKVKTSDGRTATITYQFERDITPPVVVPPANMFFTEVPIGGQVVHYPPPMVTDNCPGYSLLCSPPSGSVFPLGTTTVTCTATDAAGNSAAATFTITLQQACPPPIRSHQYAGNADSHFTHPDKPGYHTGTAMAIEAWVKRSDGARCETIISQNYNTSFWFGFCPNLRFYRSGGSAADATVAVPENQWTHVAVSYDGATARFYVNGAPAGVSALTNSGTGSAGPVTIGADFTTGVSAYEFKGYLDEVRVWDYARNAGSIEYYMSQVTRQSIGLVSTFGTGGRTEDAANTTGISGPAAPTAEIEGILPRYLVVPRTVNNVSIDGVINAGTEYAGAEKMPLRYHAGPVRDGLAQFVYRNEPTDQALYIGLTKVRNVIAPWTRAQSFVAVYFESAPVSTVGVLASAKDIRFCRRLDGTTGAGFTPVGWQRGDGAGNYTNLLPGDPLNSVPAPFGIIGAGGDTMEFRFDLSALGGSDWLRDRRLSISHHWISGVGMDYALPAGQSFLNPYTWSDLIFAGPLPELRHTRFGNQITLSWLDPGCDYVLERSPNLQPGSWLPILAPSDFSDRDGILRQAIVNDLTDPRMFFRLRR